MLYLHSAVNCSQTHKHTNTHISTPCTISFTYIIQHISHPIPSHPHHTTALSLFSIVFFLFSFNLRTSHQPPVFIFHFFHLHLFFVFYSVVHHTPFSFPSLNTKRFLLIHLCVCQLPIFSYFLLPRNCSSPSLLRIDRQTKYMYTPLRLLFFP